MQSMPSLLSLVLISVLVDVMMSLRANSYQMLTIPRASQRVQPLLTLLIGSGSESRWIPKVAAEDLALTASPFVTVQYQ